VTTPNSTTGVFHLKQPFADFNYVVAFPQTAPVPPSKDKGSNYQKHPLSTGPYKFASYQLNKHYTLVPNPQWNPSWDPQVKQLASKIIVNLNVNANGIGNRLIARGTRMGQAGSGVQAAAKARILSSPNLEAEELKDPKVNTWLAVIQKTASQSAKNSYAQQVGIQVMKDAALLPAVYSKGLLYRSPKLTTSTSRVTTRCMTTACLASSHRNVHDRRIK
jgi:Bacterial extracellular solute-binding proteins, family 5 Middle